MARERSGEQATVPEPPAWLGVVVALAFVLVAVMVVVFDIARDAPRDYGCGESEPRGPRW